LFISRRVPHPRDPFCLFYLLWKAREYDFQTEFIDLVGEVNVNMYCFVAGLVMRELNLAGRGLAGARVMILGVAYKPDVGIRAKPLLPSP